MWACLSAFSENLCKKEKLKKAGFYAELHEIVNSPVLVNQPQCVGKLPSGFTDSNKNLAVLYPFLEPKNKKYFGWSLALNLPTVKLCLLITALWL